jgi:UDP-N-acetylmuramoylalanine--D-glutamate ligase
VLVKMRKRFVILGGGESGVGAALLAKKQGYDVFLSDGGSLKIGYRNELQNAGIDFEDGKHTAEKILNADEVMKSPGIPEKAPIVKKIREKKFLSSAKLSWLTVLKEIVK